MVSKNNKHGKPKKKYKKRRTSFRNNKKNINLRSKSLKNSKGGAVGDKPSDVEAAIRAGSKGLLFNKNNDDLYELIHSNIESKQDDNNKDTF